MGICMGEGVKSGIVIGVDRILQWRSRLES